MYLDYDDGHLALDRFCLKYIRNAAIIRMLTLDNGSSKAKRIVDNLTRNRQEKINWSNSDFLTKIPAQYPVLPMTRFQ